MPNSVFTTLKHTSSAAYSSSCTHRGDYTRTRQYNIGMKHGIQNQRSFHRETTAPTQAGSGILSHEG